MAAPYSTSRWSHRLAPVSTESTEPTPWPADQMFFHGRTAEPAASGDRLGQVVGVEAGGHDGRCLDDVPSGPMPRRV
jgi:hypothetical protein